MRIVFVIPSLSMGGAERQMVILATALKSLGHDVHVFSLFSGGGLEPALLAAEIPLHSVTTEPIQTGGPMSVGRKIRLLRDLWLPASRVALTLKPDVIHGYLPVGNLLATLMKALSWRSRLVTSKRALGNHRVTRKRWVALDALSNVMSIAIVANSKAVFEGVVAREHFHANRLHVVYNGYDARQLDTDAFIADRTSVRADLGLVETDIALVYVANFILYKGHLDLLKAFDEIFRTTPQARLFLIGEERGLTPEFHSALEHSKCLGAVHLLGKRGDVPRLLLGMDVGIMASHEEGYSNALVEKLAAGLPIVATDVGGNREAVEGFSHCTIVAARQPDQTVQAVSQLMPKLPLTASERVARSAQVCAQHSVDALVEAHLSIYQQQ